MITVSSDVAFRNTFFPGKRTDTETSVESFVQEDGDGK